MSIRFAINGFGRIGRLAFRKLFPDENCEIVAINDLTSPGLLAYLLKYDTALGRFGADIRNTDRSIIVDGREIPVFSEPDAARLPWKDLQTDAVLECSGFYASRTKASAHLVAGARKVIISAPAGSDLPTIVYNVNHETLRPEDTILSAASCTTNCLAPMAKALHALVPILSGFMTTVHAYTGDQMLLDGPQRKGVQRRSRAAAGNIVPASSGAAKAIGLVIPELDGKLNGGAQRVPVLTGSSVILDAVVDGRVTAEEINRQMAQSATESFLYNTDEIVSSDIIGSSAGSIFDATQTKVLPMPDGRTLVQTAAWYDNESSYVSQLVRTALYAARL